jgi:hypothetical protein
MHSDVATEKGCHSQSHRAKVYQGTRIRNDSSMIFWPSLYITRFYLFLRYTGACQLFIFSSYIHACNVNHFVCLLAPGRLLSFILVDYFANDVISFLKESIPIVQCLHFLLIQGAVISDAVFSNKRRFPKSL